MPSFSKWASALQEATVPAEDLFDMVTSNHLKNGVDIDDWVIGLESVGNKKAARSWLKKRVNRERKSPTTTNATTASEKKKAAEMFAQLKMESSLLNRSSFALPFTPRLSTLTSAVAGSQVVVKTKGWNKLAKNNGTGTGIDIGIGRPPPLLLLKHNNQLLPLQQNQKLPIASSYGRFYRGLNCSSINNAAASSDQTRPSTSNNPWSWESLFSALNAFYRFSRPHTVIGTALSIISVSLLAVDKLSDISPLFFTGVLEAILAALLMNIYIVGLNQLSDIEIDKVNKPYLPLASGEYSVTTALVIISSFAIMSFWLGWVVHSWPLFWALSISFLLGTGYSVNLPMLRWKRFAFIAAMCILAVRAVIVQLAFYLHIQTHVYGRPAIFSKPLVFATAFMSFFSIVIALFKDIPDIIGDKIYGIQSFTVRLGQEKVFWTCILLLEMAYFVAVLVGATSACIWSKYVTVFGHMGLASLLWSRAKSVNLKSRAAITSFYMFIWKLFYAEYLLIPLVR